MNINDVQLCADYYNKNFLNTYYLLNTFNGTSFLLVAEKKNFPHLIGIKRNTYVSHGYNQAGVLFDDIINRSVINKAIIPNNISTTSKMYKKIINFCNSTNIFWKSNEPLTIRYNATLSATKLNNVDILLSCTNNGFMLGWIKDTDISLNSSISIAKYSPSTWIDESQGTQQSKEKYMPSQDIELIRSVLAFNTNSKVIKKRLIGVSKKPVAHLMQRTFLVIILPINTVSLLREYGYPP